mmetsp:Transcript_23689/g.47275  ORF Transcript_23689/g.47275 Transcript_23689/m.47275 type:complete len:93 (-) Transcript_23689:132-410(-)
MRACAPCTCANETCLYTPHPRGGLSLAVRGLNYVVVQVHPYSRPLFELLCVCACEWGCLEDVLVGVHMLRTTARVLDTLAHVAPPPFMTCAM